MRLAARGGFSAAALALLLASPAGKAYPWLNDPSPISTGPISTGPASTGPARSGPNPLWPPPQSKPLRLSETSGSKQKSKSAAELDVHGSYFFKKKKQSLFFGAALSHKSRIAAADLGYQYSFLEKNHYFRFSDLSLAFPVFSDQAKMTLGFSSRTWSELDEYWDLGLWLPRYRVDVFRPQTAGIPGLYFDFPGDVDFSAMLSYFFLPDIIIYPQIFKGSVGSKNPFFAASSKAFPKKVSWKIGQRPKLKLSALFRPAAAFQMRHQAGKSGLSLAYAFKPANQLQYAIRQQQRESCAGCVINLSAKGAEGQMLITAVDYSVISHHLFNLEGKLALNEDVSLTGSLFYENPGKAPARPGWLTENFESHLTAGFFARMRGNFPQGEKTMLSFGYVKVFEEKRRELSSNAILEEMEPFFGRSFNWAHALSSGLQYRSSGILEGLQLKLRLNYSLDNKMLAGLFESHFHLTRPLRLYLSGDILLQLAGAGPKSGASSISRYKDLSRLLAGVKYVF